MIMTQTSKQKTCSHNKLMATQTGWLCFGCFQRFDFNAYPNWKEERLKLLNELYQDYEALLTKRKPSEHKNINEMLASIKEEQCQIQTNNVLKN